ncbi:MAG: class I SAM-dependent methyltransferase [Desulfobacteraceae bacterium]|nr:class I SAM-dependent methyltransferase [Desulfobacteraceae bacterium]MBC2755199.1 class I SAM-dependent methyltransferase [Desulfobacteraceae bacterium]
MNALEELYNEIRAYKRSRIIATAIHLGILSALKSQEKAVSLDLLSSELSLARDWLSAVLTILSQYGLVTSNYGLYSLTESGMTAESDRTLKAFAGYHFHCFESWMHLPEAMKSGKSINFHRQKIKDKDFCKSYLMSMKAISEPYLDFLEHECGSYLKGQILDIGAGPSCFCRRLARQDKNINIIALDYDEIVLSAREIFGETENFRWTAGDFLKWETSSEFDAAYCGHLLEYSSKQKLPVWLRKIRSFIKNGGYLVIVIFLRDDDNGAPEGIDLFEISTGLNGTNLGYIMTRKEIMTSLQMSGFKDITIKTLPEGPSYSEYLVMCQAD